jgi:hypothetical protein
MTTQYKLLPSEPTQTMLNAVFNKAGKEVDKLVFTAIWETMWKAAPAVEQEPVAISRRYRDSTLGMEFMNLDLENGTKLYTHPHHYLLTEQPTEAPYSDPETDAEWVSQIEKTPDIN